VSNNARKDGVVINEGEVSDCSLQSCCVICKNYKNLGETKSL